MSWSEAPLEPSLSFRDRLTRSGREVKTRIRVTTSRGQDTKALNVEELGTFSLGPSMNGGEHEGLKIPHLPLSGQEISQGHHKSHMRLRDSEKGTPAPADMTLCLVHNLSSTTLGDISPDLCHRASAGHIPLSAPAALRAKSGVMEGHSQLSQPPLRSPKT